MVVRTSCGLQRVWVALLLQCCCLFCWTLFPYHSYLGKCAVPDISTIMRSSLQLRLHLQNLIISPLWSSMKGSDLANTLISWIWQVSSMVVKTSTTPSFLWLLPKKLAQYGSY